MRKVRSSGTWVAGRGGLEIHSLSTFDFHTTELDLGLNLTDFPQQKDSKILRVLLVQQFEVVIKEDHL
jgi:hypothetical protein